MPVQPTLPKHPIYVLILSDLHFGKANIDFSDIWYEIFLKAVKSFMIDKGLIDRKNRKKTFEFPHLILVPGDITDRNGVNNDGWKYARKFFNSLKRNFKADILFTPGNHDISRYELKKIFEDEKNKETIQEIIEKYNSNILWNDGLIVGEIVDKLHEEIADKCYSNYLKFVRKYQTKNNLIFEKDNSVNRLFNLYVNEKLNLCVACLNSSWLCLGNDWVLKEKKNSKQEGEKIYNWQSADFHKNVIQKISRGSNSDEMIISIGKTLYNNLFDKMEKECKQKDDWFRICMFHHNHYFLNYYDFARHRSYPDNEPILKALEPLKDIYVTGHSHYDFTDDYDSGIVAGAGAGNSDIETGFTILEIDRARKLVQVHGFRIPKVGYEKDEVRPFLYGNMESVQERLFEKYTNKDMYVDRKFAGRYKSGEGRLKFEDLTNIEKVHEVTKKLNEKKPILFMTQETNAEVRAFEDNPMLPENLEVELEVLAEKLKAAQNRKL